MAAVCLMAVTVYGQHRRSQSNSSLEVRCNKELFDKVKTRLVGRSAWNDRWIIVIPASAIDADRDRAMNLIESGVKDIKLGIRAYSRQGN